MSETINPFPNIVKEREAFLVDLKERVDLAFVNRAVHHAVANSTTTTLEENEKAKKQARWLRANSSDKVPLRPGQYTDEPHTVSVENSHDYPMLLQLALSKFYEFGLTPERARQDIARFLEHEYSHAIPILGSTDVTIRYAISFIETENGIGLQPSVMLTGRLSPDIVSEALNKPKRLSGFDQLTKGESLDL
jgi:hypothetical protein